MKITFVSADRRYIETASLKVSMYLSERTIDMTLLESPFSKAISLGLVEAEAKRSLLPVEAFYVASYSISMLTDFLFTLDKVVVMPYFPMYFYSIAKMNKQQDSAWELVLKLVEPVVYRLSEVQRLLLPDLKLFFIESVKNPELNSRIASDLQIFKFSFTVLPGVGDYDWKEFLLL